jgi:uncharacterized protein YbaR (Trm112 family)
MAGAESAVDPRLLELLVCPACRSAIEEIAGPALRCRACALVYPVRDGIPIMLVEEAQRPSAAGRLDGAGDPPRLEP